MSQVLWIGIWVCPYFTQKQFFSVQSNRDKITFMSRISVNAEYKLQYYSAQVTCYNIRLYGLINMPSKKLKSKKEILLHNAKLKNKNTASVYPTLNTKGG